MTKKIINFKHSGKIGDLIAALPTIISYKNEFPEKDMNLYLSKERADFTDESIKYLLPLLNAQPYINKAEKMETSRIDINLDEFRRKSDTLYFTHLGWAPLATYHRYYNLAKPWIRDIEPDNKADIIITKTKRYYGYFPWKEFIKEVPTRKMAFIGLNDEYKKFCQDFKTIRRIIVDNALETTEIIKGSKVFIGNQNGNLWIAEGLKTNRVLSTCTDTPNTYMIGKGAYSDFQENIIKKVKRLL